MQSFHRMIVSRIANLGGIPRAILSEALQAASRFRYVSAVPLSRSVRWWCTIIGEQPDTSDRHLPTVMTQIQLALLMIIQRNPDHSRYARWLALATILGVPESSLPDAPSPLVIATLRTQGATQYPAPPPLGSSVPSRRERATLGCALLRAGQVIPSAWIEAVVAEQDRATAVQWIAHGALSHHLDALCHDDLTDREITTLIRAGVVLPSSCRFLAQHQWHSDMPWHAIPLSTWDRHPNLHEARTSRSRTAAAWLFHYPHLHQDERFIAALGEDEHWTAEVLIQTDIRDERLLARVATDAASSAEVLIQTDIRDERLLARVATDAALSARVLIQTDIRDERLLARVATDAMRAWNVCKRRPDLRSTLWEVAQHGT